MKELPRATGAHRYAIDYIEQAPVIVLAAARGNAHVSQPSLRIS